MIIQKVWKRKAVSPVCRIKIKVWATVVASGAMDLKYSKEWLNAMKLELESIKVNEVAVPTPLSNVPRHTKVIGTKWFFRVKPDGRFKARLVALGWRQRHGIDCGITFVCRFDLLVVASLKRVNISDVQNVMLSWILDKNELNSTIHLQ